MRRQELFYSSSHYLKIGEGTSLRREAYGTGMPSGFEWFGRAKEQNVLCFRWGVRGGQPIKCLRQTAKACAIKVTLLTPETLINALFEAP
jgi:hypothetical protein